MMTNFLILLFLISNFAQVNSVSLEREWNAGDIYIWGWKNSRIRKWTNIEKDLERIDEETDIGELERNITSIDIVSKNYAAINSDYDSIGGEIGYTFDPVDFVNSRLETDTFFDVEYVFDDRTNNTILTDVDIDISQISNWLLIDPDWEIMNNGFYEMFNLSVILDTVDDPFVPLTHNFTLEYFFDNLFSFKIMGRSDYNKSLEQFVDKMKWTFKFDLSRVIYDHQYNGSWYYIPYESYISTLTLQYSEGGVLQEYLFKTESKSIFNDVLEEEINVYEWANGGLKSVSANIPIISAISGIFVISTFILIRKRRK